MVHKNQKSFFLKFQKNSFSFLLTLFLYFFSLVLFSPTMGYGQPPKEGKHNPDIDLPIASPEPKDIEDPWIPPIEDEESVVFVIDISGSMYGSRIAKAKVELSKAIDALPPNIKFTFIFYDCTVQIWKTELVDASEANKSAAKQYVNKLQAWGATGTGPAVKKALELDRKNKLIVLLTDGAPNCMYYESGGTLFHGYGTCQDHLNLILGSNRQKAQIDVYAIQPWSGSYRQFCQSIAQQTGGKYKEVQ
ncbi:MAG: VWA domain-containing protein [Planctomycetota bacterium]|nr:MAG: VWA domain-containing protein [Planctomycetota bacterium]